MKHLKPMMLICILLCYASMNLAADTEPDSGQSTGTVTETLVSGGYIYLRLEEQGIWIATSPIPVSMGDKIQYSGGMEMRDFHSKSLDRTFESIFFIQNVSLLSRDVESMHRVAKKANGTEKMEIPQPVSVQAPVPGEIARLESGKTIADIFAESDQLDEREVSLNARVIKVSQNIVGKNWITLQDGTGMAPDNKLLATSSEMVSPGDMVVAKGIVRTDIDIGSGYKYKVLLEEASFTISSK